MVSQIAKWLDSLTASFARKHTGQKVMPDVIRHPCSLQVKMNLRVKTCEIDAEISRIKPFIHAGQILAG